MHDKIQWVSLIACVTLAVSIFELVRRNKIEEKYSLLWFLTAGALLFLTIGRGILEELARAIGVHYAPNALFIVLIGFVILMLVHFSIVISRLTRQCRSLAQELAIVEAKAIAEKQRSSHKRTGT